MFFVYFPILRLRHPQIQHFCFLSLRPGHISIDVFQHISDESLKVSSRVKSKEVSKLPLASFRWYNYPWKDDKLRAFWALFELFATFFFRFGKPGNPPKRVTIPFISERCCFPGHSHDRSEIREVTGQLTRSEVISEGASSETPDDLICLLTLLKMDENRWFHYPKWFQHENLSRILLMITIHSKETVAHFSANIK